MSIQSDVQKVIAAQTAAIASAQNTLTALQANLAALQQTAALIADPVVAPAATA